MYSNEMIKKLYRVSLAALVIGLGTAAISPAQALLPAGSPNVTGPTPLNQPAPATNANEASQIPDEIALFDTEVDIPTPGSGMITHAASRKQYTVLLSRPEGSLFCFILDHPSSRCRACLCPGQQIRSYRRVCGSAGL